MNFVESIFSKAINLSDTFNSMFLCAHTVLDNFPEAYAAVMNNPYESDSPDIKLKTDPLNCYAITEKPTDFYKSPNLEDNVDFMTCFLSGE